MAVFTSGGIGTSVIRFTDQWIQSATALPAGRVAANGNGYILITSMAAYASGNGATRSISLSLLGIGGTASFSRAAAGSASDTGDQPCSVLTTATSGTFRITSNGSFYCGAGGGGNTLNNNGLSQAGSLYMRINYAQVPSAPQSLAVSLGTSSGTVALSWAAPASNGDSAITGYRIEWAKDASFTTGTGSTTVGNVTSTTVGSLTPGDTYWFRIAAINAVATAASTWSTYSATSSITLVGGVKIIDKSDPSGSELSLGSHVWNTWNWVPGEVRRLDGVGGYEVTQGAPYPIQIPVQPLAPFDQYTGTTGFGPATMYRTATDWVVMQGLIQWPMSTSIPAGTPIFQLPMGFRPEFDIVIPAITGYQGAPLGGNGTVNFRIASNGVISPITALPSSGTIPWISLSDITFYAGSGWANLTLTSPWTALDSATYGIPSAARDYYGYVSARGSIQSGSVGSQISILDPGYRMPNQTNYFPTASILSSTGAGRIFIRYATNDMTHGGGSFGNINLGGVRWPSETTSGMTWNNVSFQNGWVTYPGANYVTQYTKRRDGMVILRGRLNAGSSGTIMFTLPAGLRPPYQIIKFGWGGDYTPARIDIRPNGGVSMTTSSSAGSSIDGIMFMAAQ